MVRIPETVVAAMDIEVIQGQFVINTVDVVHRSANLLVLEVDTHSKYPSTINSDNRVFIFTHERSLKVDKTTNIITNIVLPHVTEDNGWHIMVTDGRYSVQIVAYRTGLTVEREEVWRRPDWETT